MANRDVAPKQLVMDARVASNIEANAHDEPSFPVHYIRLDEHARLLAEVTDNAAPRMPPEIIVDFEIDGEGQIYGLSDRGRMFVCDGNGNWKFYADTLKGDLP